MSELEEEDGPVEVGGASITIHGCDSIETPEERIRALHTALKALAQLVLVMHEKDGLQALSHDVQLPGARPVRYRVSVGQSPPILRAVEPAEDAEKGAEKGDA